MKSSFIGIIALLLASLFIGFVVFALPISIFPFLTENLTARLLCQDGTFRVNERVSDDGNHYTYYKCMDRKGIPQDITFQALVVPGMIASGMVFIVGAAVSFIRGMTPEQNSSSFSSNEAKQPSIRPVSTSISSTERHSPQSMSRSQRLKELKGMYDSNLISAEDYERKKNEILDQL